MDEITKTMALIIAKANTDDVFRQTILDSPITILQSFGITIINDTALIISYTPNYGLFLALDSRQFDKNNALTPAKNTKSLNDHHFTDCLH